MTRQEAIDAAPGSRGNYWSSFVVAMLGSVLIAALMLFAIRKSIPLAAGIAAMALVMGAMAAQFAERLFYPERAAMRTASLTDTQRLWMSRLRTGLTAGFGVLFAVSIVLFLFPEQYRRLSNGLRVIAWMLYMLAHLCADLLGERIGGAGLRKRGGTNILHAELQPLRSEHWGERG
jgi:hypothetical protein